MLVFYCITMLVIHVVIILAIVFSARRKPAVVNSSNCKNGTCMKVYSSIKGEKFPFPRIIHQCFFGLDGPLPETWKYNSDLWQEKHPDYEYKMWDLESSRNLIKEVDPSFLPVFDGYEYWVQKADSIRYFILYKYGGVYADLDLIPKHSIEELLKIYEKDPVVDILLATSQQKNDATNFFMVSKKGVPAWLDIIEVMKERSLKKYKNKYATVYNTTGPNLMIYIQEKFKDNVYLIPREILTPCTFCGTNCNRFSLLKDEHASSWNDNSLKALNEKVYCPYLEPMTSVTYDTWLIVIGVILLVAVVIIVILAYLLYRKNKSPFT